MRVADMTQSRMGAVSLVARSTTANWQLCQQIDSVGGVNQFG